MYELYGAKVKVVSMEGGGMICLPMSMRRASGCAVVGRRVEAMKVDVG